MKDYLTYIPDWIREQPEVILSAMLLVMAAFLVIVALWPGHPWLKGLIVAWVVLP